MKTISQFGGVLLALFLCLFLLPVPAGAEDGGEEIGDSNVSWSLDDNGTLTISGTGNMPDYDNFTDWPWYTQRGNIREVIIEDEVTSIGNYAFYYCSSLAAVSFNGQDTLKTIGNNAFSLCESLSSIKIPASVSSIGDSAFQNCTNLKEVTFAEGSQLKTIGDWAFAWCENLSSIEIPASVTSIKQYAFKLCSVLKTVTFAEGSQLETIGNSVFQECTNLEEVTFVGDSKLKTIGTSAFQDCKGLTSITIPASVTSIGDYAFLNCSELTTVTFSGTSNDVPTIQKDTFENCASLTTIYIPTAQGYGGGNWPTGVNYVVPGTGEQEDTTYRHVIVNKSGGDTTCTVTPGTSLARVGTQVTLTAVAGSDYYFTSWDVEGVSATGTTDNDQKLSFTMPDGTDVTVTANFEKTTGIYIGKTPLKENTYYVVPESSGWSQTVEATTNPGDSYAILTGNDTTGYTLTLRNFSYTGPGYEYQTKNSGASGTYYYYAAIFANKNLTIDLEGKNSVTESGNYDNDGSYTTTYGIYVVGEDLTVTGEGSLTATGGAINYNGSSYGVCVLNGSLTVSGAELTGQGGTGYDSQGVSSATSVTVQEDGKLTGIGGNSIGQSMGLYSGSLTVSGELVAKGGTAISSYGVQNSGAITIKVTSGRIVATGVSGKNYNSAVASNNDVIVKQDNPYAWRTQESGPYTYSDSDEGQYQYNRSDTYLEIASVHTLTVNQAEGGTVSVSPDGSNNCYPAGATITLTATSNSGYQFSGWKVEGVSVSDTTANPLTFTMPTKGVTVTAGWSPISSGGGVPSRPDPKPEGPSTGGSKGWEDIQQELADAKDGETVTIEMNGETEVPGEVWEIIAGRDVTVILDMGANVSWTVDGNDVPAGASFRDMDFGVNLNTTGINVDVINAITGEVSSVQITLAHDGEFGFILTLTAPLGAENAGYWANLYHYDEDDETLNYETSGEIKEDGTARLRMTHASQYAIIIDKQTHQLPFTDVASGAWYEQAVRYAYLNSIMAGTSGTAFQPNGTLSRAMAVQILYNLEGQPDISGENLGYPYSDVDAQAWYGNAVYWARITGVATGYGDGTFQPTDSITRQEFAQVLYNYAQYKGYDLTVQGDLSQFPDSGKIAGWAKTAMSWANGNGLINGHDNGLIDPTGTATRAQAASILTRFDQNVVEN